MHSFFWLYLIINASDFQLIPLDHNTYIEYKIEFVGRVIDLKINCMSSPMDHTHCNLDHDPNDHNTKAMGC